MGDSTIATAYIQLTPSTEGLTDGIKQAMGDAGTVGGNSFGAGFGKAMKTAGVVSAAAAGAVAAAGAELIKTTGEIAAYGDNIDKMSQKIGISAEAYQEWDAVMQHCGASVDSLQPAMKTLSIQAMQGNDAFQQLGISVDEVATLSQEDLFARVVEGLQDMEEGTERTYIASQLLGRGATELGALFNTSAEDTQAMIDRVHELGGVMSDDAVKSAAAYQDQLQDMQTAFDGLKRNLIGEFMPSITEVMGGLTDIFAGDFDTGLEKISTGIHDFVDNLGEIIPKVLEVGIGIIEALSTSIIENLPIMMPAVVQLIFDLVGMIIEQLPLIAEAAISIILSLADGLTAALPDLIPVAVEAVLTFASSIVGHLSDILAAAIEVVLALVQGIINALPTLLAQAPYIIAQLTSALTVATPQLTIAAVQIILALLEGLIENLPDIMAFAPMLINELFNAFLNTGLPAMLDAGDNLIAGLWDGISGSFSRMIQKIPGLMTQLTNKVKSTFGIHSPSKVFAEIGEYLDEGLAVGIDSGMNEVNRSMNDLTNEVMGYTPTLSTSATLATTTEQSTTATKGGGSIVIPVYIGQKQIESIVVDALNNSAYLSGGR